MKEHKDTRLPGHGRHYPDIHLEPSRDYLNEFTLHFDDPRGNGSLRVNLNPDDLAALHRAVSARPAAVVQQIGVVERGSTVIGMALGDQR